MPIPEYKCVVCDSQFEFLSLLTNELPSCPRCGGSNLNTLFSSLDYKRNKSCPFPSGSDTCPNSGGSCSGGDYL